MQAGRHTELLVRGVADGDEEVLRADDVGHGTGEVGVQRQPVPLCRGQRAGVHVGGGVGAG